MSLALAHKQPSRTLIIAAFAALYLVWGSTYLAIAIAIETIPPFLMAGSRFLIAGLILYTWCRLQKQPTPHFKAVTKLSFSGLMMPFFGTGSIVWVEQYIPTGLAAILFATLPLWLVLIDKRQWKFYFSNKWILIGLLVGFGGVLLLFGDKKSLSLYGDPMKLISFFVVLGGTICWAIGSLYSKYTPVDASPAMKAAVQMLAAGVLSVLTGLIIGEQNQLQQTAVSQDSLLALVYLIIMGSVVAYMAYVWLLEVRPPSLVGTYAYVNPVVAVFLGWLIADEVISGRQLAALAVIVGAVALVNFSKEKITTK